MIKNYLELTYYGGTVKSDPLSLKDAIDVIPKTIGIPQKAIDFSPKAIGNLLKQSFLPKLR